MNRNPVFFPSVFPYSHFPLPLPLSINNPRRVIDLCRFETQSFLPLGMARGGRKIRRRFCLPSCFSSPSVWDPDELEFPQEALPLAYLTRLRSLSRTVPVVEIAADGGEGHAEVSGAVHSDDALALLSPAGNQDKGSAQKFRKEEKRKTKATVQALSHTPLSCRAHYQHSVLCHVSARFNSRTQPVTPVHHARDPVKTADRGSQPGPPQPDRPARWSRRLDAVTGLLMVSATLTVMLLFGRLCAVLCNCAWFYLLSCSPPPPPPPSPPAMEIDAAAEVDVNSPEYKKKVVLMGFLERNRYGDSGTPTTPMASPAMARLR